MPIFSWPAPAKLNLFLRIIGQRADGYHELQTVFRLLDWGDTLHLQLRHDRRIQRIGTSAAGVMEQDDLAIRAAHCLQQATNCPQGITIGIEKRIPAGAGFGGGSSDAATVLVALNHLWDLHLSQDQLAAIGLGLGADVPVFVRGHNAWAEGVGEQLTPLELPSAAYVLAVPNVHISTSALFSVPELTRNANPATITGFMSGDVFDNVFEPVVRQREPALEQVWQALSRIGQPRLTGTGSGVFVEYAGHDLAQAAQQQLPLDVRSWVARGVTHSPLLDRLQEMTTA